MEIVYEFLNYRIFFDSKFKHKLFNEKWYFGINIVIGDTAYEIIHNRAGLTRILINESIGHWKDIPFKDSSIGILPECIRVEKKHGY